MSIYLEEAERKLRASKPEVVAECWTCGYLVFGVPEPEGLYENEAETCRAAGHDVRPVTVTREK